MPGSDLASITAAPQYMEGSQAFQGLLGQMPLRNGTIPEHVQSALLATRNPYSSTARTYGGETVSLARNCSHRSLQVAERDVFQILVTEFRAFLALLPLAAIQGTLAGAVARTVAQMVIHPIDTIKTRLQIAHPNPQLKLWHTATSTKSVPVTLLRSRSMVPNYVAWGVKDVYLGLAGAIVGTFPSLMLYFATYETCKRQVHAWQPSWDARLVHLLSRSAGAAASALIRVPGDVLKHNVQAFHYPNIVECARDICSRKGVRGLYKGFGATLVRDVPELVIEFTTYEMLASWFQDARARWGDKVPDLPHSMKHLVLGGAAGAVSAVLTTPLDVVKTSLQVGGADKGIVATAMSVWQERGVVGFTAGMGPRVAQTTVLAALFFCLYEKLKDEMAQRWPAAQPTQPSLVASATPLKTNAAPASRK